MTERILAEPVVSPLPGARVALQLVVVVSIAALALRLPSLLAVAAPFLLAVAVDLLARWPRAVTVVVDVPATQVLAGDEVTLRVRVEAAGGPRTAQVAVAPTPLLVGDLVGAVHEVTVGEDLAIAVTATAWGVAGVARVTVAWRSPLGLLGARAVVRPRARPLRVHPPTTVVRELVAPRRTGAWAGMRPAGVTGRGIEFAEIRPFASGDLPRDVSWRTTARRGELWVASRHPERSTDVVLLLDAFVPDAVAEVVPAAATLLDAYLRDRDRVGVLGLSGILTWVVPGGGDRHRSRVLDLLLRTQAVQGWATRDLGVVPRRALPPGALVVALTHLGDDMSRAVADLRARQRDVLVVDLTPPVPDDPARDGADGVVDDLARRLVRLERLDARDRLRRLGATVVATEGRGLAEALAAATVTRRARAVAP